MIEHPILFLPEMVRAILDGRKTQTRRVIKFPKHCRQPDVNWIQSIHRDGGGNWVAWSGSDPELSEFTKKAYPNGEGFLCPYGKPGDFLWVRETWGAVSRNEDLAPLAECKIEYRADLPADCTDYPGGWPAEDARGYGEAPKWKPSIHMPRWASRITVQNMGVRVERVQDISHEDAEAEGAPIEGGTLVRNHRIGFENHWNAIYAPRGFGWDANPWVWAITFRKVIHEA
jgi:hypothetical protein